jgi:PTH1 family peptidyl-tRNA hydrolase
VSHVKLIVGLGNPGGRYHATRHNVGFLVIDALAVAHRMALRKELPTAQYGEGAIGIQRVVLAKPLTYMNVSGAAVAALTTHFSIPPDDLLVIHDDLDLVLGRIKLKTKGGDAGHYGVRSVIEHLGTGHFTRLRIGIGRPPTKEDIVSYVLSPFAREELPLLEETVRMAAERVEKLVTLPQ